MCQKKSQTPHKTPTRQEKDGKKDERGKKGLKIKINFTFMKEEMAAGLYDVRILMRKRAKKERLKEKAGQEKV